MNTLCTTYGRPSQKFASGVQTFSWQRRVQPPKQTLIRVAASIYIPAFKELLHFTAKMSPVSRHAEMNRNELKH